MQMIVLLHEEHVCGAKNHKRGDEVDPVCKNSIRAKEDKPEAYRQLQRQIKKAHRHMAHLQLVRHQLIAVLPVRFPKMLVQHDAMEDGQATVNAAK